MNKPVLFEGYIHVCEEYLNVRLRTLNVDARKELKSQLAGYATNRDEVWFRDNLRVRGYLGVKTDD